MPNRIEKQIIRDQSIADILKIVLEIKEILLESKDSKSTKKASKLSSKEKGN